MTAAEILISLYENALREIVEALGSDEPDAAQAALEIAADALASGEDAP
ncbi:hypothetical protein LNAOJCKE_5204 [Methylorubrum aminovorans]|uniref:Uncharacterized protein n=1 Tax=Methylorubrum aminovorans TaxID=269069 RepID=A0ABQ4ULR4_9HYPH|nr:hypothetical protein [Methylorubrum aminovorans]GJE67968.1 hypothetical protein LNAOJCKE_5204 [Methylorubrum aminovorans]GMA76322.1 hypothetical protein GCM10025880_27390 [Methylorubrum aminovorans]